jgi:glycosyltransferase involved in cell wall biosynthesis
MFEEGDRVVEYPHRRFRSPRVAIVSDPLVQRGGAERTVEALADAFPDAPIFALLYSADKGPASLSARVQASWLNSLPGAARRHRAFLPLFRNAIESFDVSAFDVILSSHHTVAKGVLTRADQVHVCYCHTPMRALWERSAQELATLPPPVRPLAGAFFSHLREWDAITASRVQRFVANSTTTQRRIATYYRRESDIIHPPIDTRFFTPDGKAEDYYLVASRPVPYKRIDIAVAATKALGRKLKIVGGQRSLRDAPPNVELLGHVSNEELRSLMRGARALLFPQYEDFGLTPLEMNACGRPVVAYGAGGVVDTVVSGATGVLAPEQTVASFTEAIRAFEDMTFDSASMRQHALRFSRDRFVAQMREVVAEAWDARMR